jgi:hypothetical protein
MKLWKAILIGCDRRAQAFGSYFAKNLRDDTVCSCVLGAAYEGVVQDLSFLRESNYCKHHLDHNCHLKTEYSCQLDLPEDDDNWFSKTFPHLFKSLSICPEKDSMIEGIVHEGTPRGICLFNGGNDISVMRLVEHLNDDHRWSRERIALEFVKPIEDLIEGDL